MKNLNHPPHKFHKNLTDSEARADDIVQITDETHPWFPALVVVTEPRPWGVVGFVFMPQNNSKPKSCHRAYTRLLAAQFEKVGTSVIVVKEPS